MAQKVIINFYLFLVRSSSIFIIHKYLIYPLLKM